MNPSTSVQEQVFSTLRGDIITMRLLPGASMSVYEVSEKLGVSRTPVREAFIRLAAESLGEILPQRKTLVSRIDLARVQQERFLRAALELAAVPLFVRRLTPSDIVEMKDLCMRHAALMETGDTEGALALDDALHRCVFLGAGQALSWGAVEKTNGHYRRARLLMIRENGEAEGVAEEHAAIIEALEARNAEEAMRRTRRHLDKIACCEDALRAKYPGYFTKGAGYESDTQKHLGSSAM